MKRRAAAVFALVATCLPCGARSDAPAAHVVACGLEFDLPADYKITRPKRSTNGRDGSQCAFDIVKAKPEPPQRGECKDEEDGGQPPYDVCDWMIDGGPATPSVRVVRARLEDLPRIEPFFLEEDGHWMLPNAQAGDQAAERFDFHGKPAWRGEAVVRLSWWRQRVKDYTGIYAGSGGTDVTLVQFAPDLFVQLQDPPADENGECGLFCASLRLGARTQDLP